MYDECLDKSSLRKYICYDMKEGLVHWFINFQKQQRNEHSWGKQQFHNFKPDNQNCWYRQKFIKTLRILFLESTGLDLFLVPPRFINP